jgi:uncharacterized repeat protein (TIGR02543 family)
MLTVNTDGTGSGSVTKSVDGVTTAATSFNDGTVVTLTAQADLSNTFGGWSGDTISANELLVIRMGSHKSLIAMFNLVSTPGSATYQLSMTAAPTFGGTITSVPNLPSYTEGATVVVTAAPEEGYRFVGWAGASSSTNERITVTMNGNRSLIGMFAPITYTLTVNANPTAGGVVNRNPTHSLSQIAGTYITGTQVTVTATANTDYAFNGWSGASTSTNPEITLTMNSNQTLTAHFQLNVTNTSRRLP